MPHHSQTEIERKYDVDAEARHPLLVGVGAVAVQQEPERHELVATYFDTADLTLAQHRTALRVRRGGHDEGWHVKEPAEEGRTELQWPLTDGDEPPADLRDHLRPLIGDEPLVPIARVTNQRDSVVLLDAAGFEVAELTDDHVRSENLRAGGTQEWREWEVELLAGAPDTRNGRTALLDGIEERLLAAGARPSASSSKLQRALGL
ncbi:CYTH domain-containing protein [Leifsonia sp. C5G2]|uniref:CYTH domain-containing protein n=1 Tax=Leifsonia sp. C5G2 TaxID=2735269 RepID=UPI00158448A5|nr:CYTH domain-containing protein [Leifsonia sp. C5G2]NUU05716.1 CYTH domain-containing protein [Leifsonia sp. C5G2]